MKKNTVVLWFLAVSFFVQAFIPQLPGAYISSPRDGETIQGQVAIRGTANIPDFWKYELHYLPEFLTGENWMPIGGIVETPVVDGLLGVWDTTKVPDGSYVLRLRVARRDGNYVEVFVRDLMVANQAPIPTPTPTPATPEPSPTPLPPTPTVIIELPATPTPFPSPTIPPRPTPTRTDNYVFDPGKLFSPFCYGMAAAGLFFAFFGFLFLMRAIIHSMRRL